MTVILSDVLAEKGHLSGLLVALDVKCIEIDPTLYLNILIVETIPEEIMRPGLDNSIYECLDPAAANIEDS